MRFSSISTPGMRAISEPVATTIFLASSVCFEFVRCRHLELAGSSNASLAVDRIDLVFLQQEIDALDVALHRLILEAEHRWKIELRLHPDAKMRKIMARLSEALRSVKQRLGWDAADVEASAAMGGAFLDDCDFHSELSGADGANITAGAGADDNEIVLHPILISLLGCQSLLAEACVP